MSKFNRGFIKSNGSLGSAIVFAIGIIISTTGFLLRGDETSKQFQQLGVSLLSPIPSLGGYLTVYFSAIVTDLKSVFVYHVTFALTLLFILASAYFRMRKTNFPVVFAVLLLVLLTGIVFNANTIDTQSDRGYFGVNIDLFSSHDSLRSIQKPPVLGRYEGCVYCHSNVKGFNIAHSPDSIGCSSCHLGYPFSLEKQIAHNGMILIPGNLSTINTTCGSAKCHPDIAGRVNGTLMNSMSGVVSVDKYVFGETKSLNVKSDINTIDQSPSDKHLRNLCASCHLSKDKSEFGEVIQSSRGGGCLACHLNYSADAKNELTNKKGEIHTYHPDVSLSVTDDHCFGCHSRSGRISTNYEGWYETQLKPVDAPVNENYRILEDERVFEKHKPDVHFEKGMQCTDCHLSYELMGDGMSYLHEEQQVKIRCADCHSMNYKNTVSGNDLDFEAKKILKMKGFPFEKLNFINSSISGYALTNAYFDSSGKPVLLTKTDNRTMPLMPPTNECSGGKVHERLSCSSCHTATVSQCIGCHTEYKSTNIGYDLLDDKDSKGEWVESSSNIFNEPPTLGIRIVDNNDGTTRTEIITFAPGMVLTIDNGEGKQIFKRLFAPIEAHNILKEARSCKSCHNNPVALGYGRGELVFSRNGRTRNWTFTPAFEISQSDGLPMDAWIGFLTEPAADNSTRENTRPFGLSEQKEILSAGACLTCHDGESKVMKESLLDFGKVIKKMKGECVKPF